MVITTQIEVVQYNQQTATLFKRDGKERKGREGEYF